MFSTKFFIVLCLGVLAVQAKPQLRDRIDDIVEDLEELNKLATTEQKQSIDKLGGELKSLDDISKSILNRLQDDLKEELVELLLEISKLQEKAYELNVDIQECVGNSLDLINALPLQFIGDAGQCVNGRHAEAERAVNDGVRRITEAVGPIDEYWKDVDRCSNLRPQEQEICIAELSTEIRNDRIEIPSKIRLAVEEAIGHLEAEKPTLRLCADGKVERFDQEGRRIITRVTDCAERMFPPEPTPFK